MEFMIERGSQVENNFFLLLYTIFYIVFDLVKWQKYVFPPLNHNLVEEIAKKWENREN